MQNDKTIFFILLVSYLLFYQPFSDVNERSRLALTYSIVNYHTFNIDNYHTYTIDKAFYNGHYFCDKAPGISLIAVPVFAVLKFAGLPSSPSPVVRQVLSFIFSAIPTIILVFYLYKFLCQLNVNETTAKIVILGYSLATLAFPFSLVFYPYQLVSCLVFISFYFVYNKKKYFLSGLICGLAIISEYTVLPVIFFIFVYIFFTNRRQTGIFVISIIPFILLNMVYNKICFDNFFTIGYCYEFWKSFNTEMSKGLFGISRFSFSNFYQITVSPYRGLFFYSPWLVLTFFGIKKFYKNFRQEFILFSAIVIYFFILGASYWSPCGGTIVGPRILVPMLPFFIVFAGFVTTKLLLACFVVFSFLIIFSVVLTNIHLNQFELNPILNNVVPSVLSGDFIRHWSLILGYLVCLILSVRKHFVVSKRI
ncbi:MAG: hypothetical protein AB1349_07815 [Elusimicrobiota bacterium]